MPCARRSAAVIVQTRKQRQLARLRGSGGSQLRPPQFKNVFQR